MNSAKTKKGKGANRRSSSDSEDDVAFTVPMSLAEEDVNIEHDMVVSSLVKPKRAASGYQQTQPQNTNQTPLSPANRQVSQHTTIAASTFPREEVLSELRTQLQNTNQTSPSLASRQVQQHTTTATSTSAFPREEVLSELQERLAATKLEEKPQPSQSQPATGPSRSYRSPRLSAGRREHDRSTLHTVPADPTSENDRAARALDALAGMVRANPKAWPTTAVCMALLCPQSRHRIMPRYGKQFWEDAAEAIFGPVDDQ